MREWVEKVEGDFRTARREASADPPSFDAAVFHAHQCAEKILKALLIEGGIPFPKTHDLGALLNLLPDPKPSWKALRSALDELTSLGIEVRYPGVSADADDVAEAQQTAAQVRTLARRLLEPSSVD